MDKALHKHDYKPVQVTVALHNYVHENGKITKDLISGKDVLQHYKCDCGKTETRDLKRVRR
jgi:hypothetical protein